jgi:ferritin-like metal-binding protein YciE
MAKAATSPALKQGFEKHTEQTQVHAERLEEIFEILDESPKGKTCKAMKGLVEEGAEAIEEDAPDAVKDANLIGAAQRVEHYEIAAYGTARAFAEILDEKRIVKLLQQTLAEEEATDKKLTALSAKVNRDALELVEVEE